MSSVQLPKLSEHDTQQRLLQMDDQTLGTFGEALWGNIFRASGVAYIPLSQIENGGAPRLEGQAPVVLPDFEVFADGFTFYADSKAKTKSVVWRKKNQERHGIDRRVWQHYRTMAIIGRKDCGLAIVELLSGRTDQWSGTLLLETLTNLGEPYAGESSLAHMVFWPRKQFVNIDSLSARDLHSIAKGRSQYSIRPTLERMFAAKVLQQRMF